MIKPLSLGVGLGLLFSNSPSGAASLQVHSKAWTETGEIERSTDTLQSNFNGNRMQSMGLQINGTADLGENLEGRFGFGLAQGYHSFGDSKSEKLALSKFVGFISNASITYSLGDKSDPGFSVTAGDFAFNYNPDVKNLGLYLFRGPVYPGFLVSGFKDFHTDTTRASFLGLRLHNALGNFHHDLILSSETELAPYYDWSLGYIAQYKAWNALNFGVGVNFYHLIPNVENITQPKSNTVKGLFSKDSSLIAAGGTIDPYQLQYMEVRAPGDTIVYGHQGTKLMAMFDLDIKKLLGFSGPFGEKDLILYGEGALIGVKNYGSIYAHRNERIPVMVGFNIPTFGLLDFLSFEVEHYGAKYKADYSKLGLERSLYFRGISPPPSLAQNEPSAIPISTSDLAGSRYQILPNGDFYEIQTGDTLKIKGTDLDPENTKADDWKWSVNIEKTVAGHIQFSGQVANDHYIPRPIRTGLVTESGGLSEVLTSKKDWYFMARIGYFF
jgi:hypothetical protein